ncbi:hypothetical protein PR202_ga14253 [Eleusine coracana subsp. coracana]|uniref:Uncharacterized protein n=1 Tax=Eleusine coracana subsp. coracana TaxID=191504 RepID=A0AAV5CGW3_ELECO|nr:hypothetical protein PR202_ga14253 [Eleusine coracana subsp. coracana]
MARTDWEADKMLDVYIYDYLVKRNLQATAKAFISEGKVATDPVAIDAPGGFLFEWWSIFWDIFHSTTKSSSSSSSVSLNNNNPMMLQHPPPGSGPGINSSDVTAVLASKMMMQDRLRHPNSDHHHLLDPNTRMALLTKSPPPNHQSHSGFTREISSNPTAFATADSPEKSAATCIDQLRSNLGALKQLVPSSNQFQLLSPLQQLIAQAQTQNDITRMGSPAPSGSPNVRSDDPDYLMKSIHSISFDYWLSVFYWLTYLTSVLFMEMLKMAQMQQCSGLRVPELPHQQNTRKRKPTSSGAANNTGTGNTVGPSPPSTPSTHTPGGGVPVASNVNTAQKSSMICGTGGTSGLASSSNQMDNLDSFVDFDENVDSFLSNDDGDGRGMSVFERGWYNRTSTNKVVCCHFSTDGKLLASAGHEKKETGALQTFHGHSSHVTSVDFHPRLTEYLCSCDDTGEIRFWTVGQTASSNVFRVKQGGNGRVRFQPRSGQLLAVAAGSMLTFLMLRNKPIYILLQRYPKVLIVGGYQTLELWSLGDNQRNPIQAHEGLIAALAHSPFTKMIASASHDRYVKLWK